MCSSFLCIEAMRECDYNLYHLKCILAGACGQYYEEIFGTHFYHTLLCLNFEGDRFVIAWIFILIRVEKRVNQVMFKYFCIVSHKCSRNKMFRRVPHQNMCKVSFVYLVSHAVLKIIDLTISCPCHKYFYIVILSYLYLAHQRTKST
jgi:hypothetical protein